VLALLLIASAPIVWSTDWSERTTEGLASYLSPRTGSQFPLVPWSAFILVGAALGQLYARWGAAHIARYANRALLVPGALLIAFSQWLTRHQVALFGSGLYAYVPGNMLLRTGACLALVGLVAHLSRRIAQLPHMFGAIAQESLLIYVLHLCVVYGSVWAPGLLNIYGPTRTPLQVLPLVVLLIASMALAAYAWNWLKHAHARVARYVSLAVGVIFAIRLLI
jgi:uncharacterized membrane protein